MVLQDLILRKCFFVRFLFCFVLLFFFAVEPSRRKQIYPNSINKTKFSKLRLKIKESTLTLQRQPLFFTEGLLCKSHDKFLRDFLSIFFLYRF